VISFTLAAVPRPRFSKVRTFVTAALSLGLILSASVAGTAQAATTLNVGVGVGSGTTSGNVYLPGDMTILVGDSVKFTIESQEEHSITIGSGPAGVVPADWPVSGFPGTVLPPPAVQAISTTYAGTGLLNTWLLSKGSSATITFTTAGTFPFICVIHPGMSGTVKTVASGTTTTQADADARAAMTRTAILGAVDSVEAAQTANVTETKQANGTSLWNIFTNSAQAPAPQPGGGTGYLEVYHFVPPTLEIEAGDTVEWTALNVHTVTFPASGQDPATIDPFGTEATTDATYDGTSLYHSGLLAWFEPGSPNTYRLTFPDAGTFAYICALHLPLGQTGEIVVTGGPVVTAPPTDARALPSPPATDDTPWLPIGFLAVLSMYVVKGALVVRRR
jgi:plastocyanin